MYLFVKTDFLRIVISIPQTYYRFSPDLIRHLFFSIGFIFVCYLLISSPISFSKYERATNISLYNCTDEDLRLNYKHFHDSYSFILDQSASFFPFLILLFWLTDWSEKRREASRQKSIDVRTSWSRKSK